MVIEDLISELGKFANTQQKVFAFIQHFTKDQCDRFATVISQVQTDVDEIAEQVQKDYSCYMDLSKLTDSGLLNEKLSELQLLYPGILDQTQKPKSQKADLISETFAALNSENRNIIVMLC